MPRAGTSHRPIFIVTVPFILMIRFPCRCATSLLAECWDLFKTPYLRKLFTNSFQRAKRKKDQAITEAST